MIQERYDKIIKQINAKGIVKVPELMKEFRVSIETVRRDLEVLEKQGFLKRVYGGAILNASKGVEPTYSSREVLNQAEKHAIALKTLEFINDRDTIAIDLGTTTLEIAKMLNRKQDLTVITNSLQVAMELINQQNKRVFLIGGQLRGGEYATSGFLAMECLKRFRVDKAIVGVGGITTENGIADYHVEEAYVRKQMIDNAEQVIAVADHSKFGVSALIQVCQLSEIDLLVTDWKVPDETVQQFEKLQLAMVTAPKPV